MEGVITKSIVLKGGSAWSGYYNKMSFESLRNEGMAETPLLIYATGRARVQSVPPAF